MPRAAARFPQPPPDTGEPVGPAVASPRRQGWAWCAAAVLVALGWLLTPHPVALYDGVGLPDEPYRYVSAPPGAKTTPPPTAGAMSMAVDAGTIRSYLSAMTEESGPQATAGFPQGALAAAAGPVTVRVAPMAPVEQPPGVTIDGNVYQVDVTAPGGPVRFTSEASQAAVYLRAPARGPIQVIWYRPGPGQAWTALQTSQAGGDVWGAVPPGPGQFALAVAATTSGDAAGNPAASGASGDQATGSGFSLGVVVLGAVVVALVAVLLVVRRRATALDR